MVNMKNSMVHTNLKRASNKITNSKNYGRMPVAGVRHDFFVHWLKMAATLEKVKAKNYIKNLYVMLLPQNFVLGIVLTYADLFIDFFFQVPSFP